LSFWDAVVLSFISDLPDAEAASFVPSAASSVQFATSSVPSAALSSLLEATPIGASFMIAATSVAASAATST